MRTPEHEALRRREADAKRTHRALVAALGEISHPSPGAPVLSIRKRTVCDAFRRYITVAGSPQAVAMVNQLRADGHTEQLVKLAGQAATARSAPGGAEEHPGVAAAMVSAVVDLFTEPRGDDQHAAT